jgi:hypothetical protein
MPWTRKLWGQTTTLRCDLLTSVGQGIRVGLIILWGLLAARAGYPWGDTGHELICEIAFQELTPQARTQVTQLLQEDPCAPQKFLRPTLDVASFSSNNM